jgi:hypothetical protein
MSKRAEQAKMTCLSVLKINFAWLLSVNAVVVGGGKISLQRKR